MSEARPGTEVARFADVAMYKAMPNPMAEQGLPVEPQVYLVSMTPRPLQTLAAASLLYRGVIVTDPAKVSKETALHEFAQMTKTVLEAPLEFIDLHFFIEGVSRDITHQIVRQRTAVFVQESLRFAIKENSQFEEAIPPSIARLKEDDPARVIWDNAARLDALTYNALIDAGIPAEDARKRLPHAITTRIQYKSNLRNLTPTAGMRLCSQAQWDWKKIWIGIVGAILNYGPPEERWQQEEIVKLFRPICYQEGRCKFRADTDRACSIRDRVEAHYAKGEGPDLWLDIDPREPLLEGAARVKPGR